MSGGRSNRDIGHDSQPTEQEIANDAQIEANAAITASNSAAMAAANARTESLSAQLAASNEEAARTSAAMTAGNEAGSLITAERTNAIRDSGKLLTDFERQEKLRKMHAMQGTGQVTDEDTMLSDADRENALELLNRSPEYWDERRKKAYDEAYTASYGEGPPISAPASSYEASSYEAPAAPVRPTLRSEMDHTGTAYEGTLNPNPTRGGDTLYTSGNSSLLGGSSTYFQGYNAPDRRTRSPRTSSGSSRR